MPIVGKVREMRKLLAILTALCYSLATGGAAVVVGTGAGVVGIRGKGASELIHGVIAERLQ